jgi:hypothetical protein
MAKVPEPQIDFSLESWLYNTRSVLAQPFSLFILVGLLVVGTFAEVAPRSNFAILDNVVGRAVLFGFPFLISYLIDWSTGLLAAVVCLIVYARIEKSDVEGFVVDSGIATKPVTDPKRWFVEQVLGERPVAISDDRVITRAVSDDDNRTSSSSSMNNNGPSDSS